MTRPTVFISYSHRDEDWKDRLRKQLGVLNRQKQLSFSKVDDLEEREALDPEIWSAKDDVGPGKRYREEIAQALKQARVAVLLLSDDFIDSNYIYNCERPAIRSLQDKGQLDVLPIIVRPCNWQADEWLEQFQARPFWENRLSLAQGTPVQQDEDLTRIAREISGILRDFRPSELQSGQDEDAHGRRGKEKETTMAPVGIPRRQRHAFADLELALHHRDGDEYLLRLRFSQSGKDDDNEIEDALVRIPVDELTRDLDDPTDYGRRLGKALFGADAIREALAGVKKVAGALNNEAGIPLSVRVLIGSSARELMRLRWETLRIPLEDREIPIFIDDLVFSTRYMLSGGGAEQRIQLASRPSHIHSLLADIFPRREPDGFPLPDFDSESELRMARECIQFPHPKGEDGDALEERRLDFNALINRLKRGENGVDILFLVCHAVEKGGRGHLVVEDTGVAVLKSGVELQENLRGISRLPRLAVLCPAKRVLDARTAAAQVTTALLDLAGALAEAGISAVLTIQGPIDAKTWFRFLRAFFQELVEEGEVDRAIHIARRDIITRTDWWVPVLVSRLKIPRVWYAPGFPDARQADAVWDSLKSDLDTHGRQPVPVLGPGLVRGLIGSRRKIAEVLADKYYFPLAITDRFNLREVTQYLALGFGGRSAMERKVEEVASDYLRRRHKAIAQHIDPKIPLDDLINQVANRLLDDENEPHRILASLPFPIYVTTNQARLLSVALGLPDIRKKATTETFDYSVRPRGSEEMAMPTVESPYVYHLFGKLDDPSSLVLTEDDYFDFLLKFSKEKHRIPLFLRTALTDHTLIFLGFSLHQWEFRVLLRTLLSFEASEKRSEHPHIAVQIDPDDDQTLDLCRARRFLETHFTEKHRINDTRISIYWGSSEDFLIELRDKWKQWNP